MPRARAKQNQGLQRVVLHSSSRHTDAIATRASTITPVRASTEHLPRADAEHASRARLSCIAQADLRETAQKKSTSRTCDEGRARAAREIFSRCSAGMAMPVIRYRGDQGASMPQRKRSWRLRRPTACHDGHGGGIDVSVPARRPSHRIMGMRTPKTTPAAECGRSRALSRCVTRRQCSSSSISAAYSSGVSSSSSWPTSSGSMAKIQPSPKASSLMVSGLSDSAWLTATTLPAIGL